MSLATILAQHGIGDAPKPSGALEAAANDGPARRAVQERVRGRLLDLARAEGIHAGHVRALDADDLAACDGMTADVLCAYLRAVRDSADRKAGRVPADETAQALCRACGPVWLAPEVVALAAPTSGPWREVLACPWCTHRKAGLAIPRPGAP